MKANELRIGNYVQRLTDIIQVSDISGKTMSMFHPIPLTEDWFVKFGFEKVGNLYAKYSFTEQLEYECEFIIAGDILILNNNVHTKCNHVHQLQNLYFALTNQELTIK